MKETLSHYLYNALEIQILTEKFQYGDSLPSARHLSSQYNVGVRTVKDVLKKLRANSYIHTEERKNAVVVYRKSQQPDDLQPILHLLEKKNAVIEVLTVMEHILPSVFASAALLCTPEEIESLARASAEIEKKPLKEKWRIGSEIFQKILSKHNNPLLMDLYIDMNLFAQVPVFEGFENPFAGLTMDKKEGLNHIFRLMLRKDYANLQTSAKTMFAEAAKSIGRYLEELSARHSRRARDSEKVFSWNAKKGRVHIYLEIARKLTAKIGEKKYEDNAFLPSAVQLAREYGVSLATINKAIAVMNQWGLVQTINGKGSLVTLERAKTVEIRIKDGSLRSDCFIFLCALHLLCLMYRKTAFLAFGNLNGETVQRIAEEVNDAGSSMLPEIFLTAIASAQPYETLKTLYRETEEIRRWGYYFAFARHNEACHEIIRDKCRRALGYIEANNIEAFADMMEDTCAYVFNILKRALIEYGVTECERLSFP